MVAELEQQLKRSGTIQARLRVSLLDNAGKRPLLPFSLPQVGLVGGSGCINGYAGGKAPHIIKGRIIKNPVVRDNVLREDKQKRPTHIQREVTHTNRLVFNILTPEGFRRLS